MIIYSSFCTEISIVSIHLNNINLYNTNDDKDDPETIIRIRRLAY